MTWDDDKSTAADPDNPAADEQLTADEWDNHVGEGHFLPSNLRFGQNADGDPIMTDPQNGGQTVLRYDRSAGDWVMDSLSTENARITTESSITDAVAQDDRLKIAKRTSINGTEIWSFSGFSDNVFSSPTVVDGVVYVGSDDSTLRAIDASDGTEIWEFSGFSDNVFSSPTVVDGVVYVGSFDNTLRAIDAVERFARLYVADTHGWIPIYRGPNEPSRVAGSTLTGNASPVSEDYNR